MEQNWGNPPPPSYGRRAGELLAGADFLAHGPFSLTSPSLHPLLLDSVALEAQPVLVRSPGSSYRRVMDPREPPPLRPGIPPPPAPPQGAGRPALWNLDRDRQLARVEFPERWGTLTTAYYVPRWGKYYCRLCWKWMDDTHVASPAHLRRLGNPQRNLDLPCWPILTMMETGVEVYQFQAVEPPQTQIATPPARPRTPSPSPCRNDELAAARTEAILRGCEEAPYEGLRFLPTGHAEASTRPGGDGPESAADHEAHSQPPAPPPRQQDWYARWAVRAAATGQSIRELVALYENAVHARSRVRPNEGGAGVGRPIAAAGSVQGG